MDQRMKDALDHYLTTPPEEDDPDFDEEDDEEFEDEDFPNDAADSEEDIDGNK